MPLLTGVGLAMLLFLMAMASSVCETLGLDGDGDGDGASVGMVADGPAVEGAVRFAGGEVELPDGAVVEVLLQDTSLADAPAVTLGEYVVHARSIPVPFRIPYDPAAIDERFEYTLQASVTLDGRLLYVNDTVHLVLTGGAPEDIDVEVIRVP